MLAATPSLYDKFRACLHATIDSRQVKPGNMFFALKGQRVHGGVFVKEAFERGALYAVVDDRQYQYDERCILVEDVAKALQDLAHYHRQQFNVPVIGITGSTGKTTTKELVKAVL